jgi:hypothetical protein
VRSVEDGRPYLYPVTLKCRASTGDIPSVTTRLASRAAHTAYVMVLPSMCWVFIVRMQALMSHPSLDERDVLSDNRAPSMSYQTTRSYLQVVVAFFLRTEVEIPKLYGLSSSVQTFSLLCSRSPLPKRVRTTLPLLQYLFGLYNGRAFFCRHSSLFLLIS